jgi:hypothetical protein
MMSNDVKYVSPTHITQSFIHHVSAIEIKRVSLSSSDCVEIALIGRDGQGGTLRTLINVMNDVGEPCPINIIPGVKNDPA